MAQVHPVKIFDISVPIVNGGVVYPGNAAIRIEPHSQVSKGASSNSSTISFGSHTGTHVDSPKHFFDTGSSVDQLPLSALMGPARLIAYDDSVMSVTAPLLQREKLEGVERVLIRTRNSGTLPHEPFRPDFTYVAPDGAEYLASIGVKLVGVDYLSVEQFRSGHHKTHRTLLERNIVIVEGLDFSAVPPGNYTFYCLPLLLEGLDGAPARAVLTQ
jgi:arylformamidase